MSKRQLQSVANSLIARGKGILAADESLPTIKKRFDGIGAESTEESRRAYRELLFTTPGMEEFISGVILFDETIRQKSQSGIPLADLLSDKGVIPGIKVDKGAKDLARYPGEKVTEGLDGLRDRLDEYRKLGARFAKWRAVIKIGSGVPTRWGIESNAHALARYAALCQESGLVPIVEPEVLMDGDHYIGQCEEVTSRTLITVFSLLYEHRVEIDGILLKPNMVVSGKGCPHQAGPEEVARATLRCFEQVLPPALPGVVFLSGGQSPVQATMNLNAMNIQGDHPWELSFSYGRALQEPVLKAWGGEPGNVVKAQKAFYHRAKCNGAARYGKYLAQMESEAP
jgi:fructose-bisphosphate aldolase class I